MKISKAKLIIFSLSLLLLSCNNNEEIITIKKTIKPLNNSSISGTISLTQKKDSVFLEAHVFGLEPGIKAIHIHENGDCSSNDGLSAGGHWNPTSQKHSKWGDETGFHLGDIGNFNIDSIGHGMVNFSNDIWCLGCKSSNDLMNKSIIIHNGEDDFLSQPSGAAGMRLGCLEISTEVK